MNEKMPVVLILFDASRRRAYWLAIKDYFQPGSKHRPKKGAKTVRVRVGQDRVLDRMAIGRFREMVRLSLDR